jgi:hypothetical protein
MTEPQWAATLDRVYTVCDRFMTIASVAVLGVMIAAIVTLVVLIWRR